MSSVSKRRQERDEFAARLRSDPTFTHAFFEALKAKVKRDAGKENVLSPRADGVFQAEVARAYAAKPGQPPEGE